MSPRFRLRFVLLTVLLAPFGVGSGCATIRWSPAHTTFAVERAEFEFALIGKKPYLVTEDDQNFLIDTGASGMIVSEGMVRRGGDRIRPLRVRAAISDAAGRTRVLTRAVRVPRFTLGDVTFNDFVALVLKDIDGEMPLDGDDAILGMGLFRDCAITFDYANSTMRLERSVRGSPPPEGAAVLPLRLEEGCPYVPIVIGGRRVWALLDTGSGGGIDVSQHLARDLTFVHPPAPMFIVKSAWAQRRAAFGRLASDVRLGPFVLRRPVVEVSPDEVSIGGDVLRHFVVTIDAPNMRVLLRRSSAEPIESPPVWHCGFVPARSADGGGYKVFDLIPGTHAQRIGLSAGDCLLTLNGVPFDKLKDWSWAQPSGERPPITVEAEGSGRRRTYTIYPTLLIP